MSDRPAESGSPAPATPAPSRKKTIVIALGALTLVAVIGGTWYWIDQQQYVFSDKADVEAPLIKLAPHVAGELKRVLVNQGDALSAYQSVARVGDEMITAQVPGIAVIVKKDLGTVYTPGTAVVTMIEPKELRIVARIDEDKGLKYLHVGQRTIFTVDAFGSKQYEGEVESVSQTNRSGDVVFNISDQRQEQEFEVKVRYDTEAYPELQNGMSARVWIVK